MKSYKWHILILCIFLSSCITSTAKRVAFIKISSNDCILCNFNLENVYKQTDGIEKIIVLKEEDKDDVDFLNSLKITSRTNTKVVFSDELYYKYDKTERSMLYVIINDTVRHQKLLKEITINDLQFFFHAKQNTSTTSTLSKMPKRSELVDLGDFIGIFDKKKCIRIQKKDLTKIYDTINLILPQVINDAYKSAFGDSAQQKLELYNKMQSLYGQSLSHSVKAVCYNNDTLYGIININYAVMVVTKNGADTALRFEILQHLAYFKDGKYLGQSPIENTTMFQNTVYTILPLSLFAHKGKIYCQIWKENLSDKNPLVAEMTNQDGKTIFKKITLVELPKLNVEYKLGYDLVNTSHSGKFLCINTDTVLYDMEKEKKYSFPFYQASNNISQTDVKNLNSKFSSLILSIYVDKEMLNIIFMSNDSVKYARCKTNSTSIQLVEEKLLEDKYSSGNYYYVVADKTGYYRHVKNKGIEFNFY